MRWVIIDGAVRFCPNGDFDLDKEVLDWDPEQLHAAIQLAFSHMKDPLLVDGFQGHGPLAVKSDLSFEEYMVSKREAEIAAAASIAKSVHTKNRRREFDANRSQLILRMIEAGIPHVCSHEHCDVTEELTVDHKIPLSRGGTDEISNLQFLCRSHNSVKGDKL